MSYLAIHHSAGRQIINKPSDIGGNYKFYNVIIGDKAVFKQSDIYHPRGPFRTLDICLTGDFTKISPNQFQLDSLKQLIKESRLPVLRHKDLKRYGATIGVLETECPGKLNMTFTFKLVLVNCPNPSGLQAEVEKFSRGKVKLEITSLNLLPIIPLNGEKITNDEAVAIYNSVGIKESLMLFYQSPSPWIFATTFYKDFPIIACDSRTTLLNQAYEISHAVQKYYNENRPSYAPPVQVDDINTPTEDYIYKKFDSITPFLPLLEDNVPIDMLRMVKLDGPNEDIYLIDSAGLKSKIFNVGLFQKIGGNIDQVEKLTQQQLDAIPDSGVELAEIKKL